ncbi:hypothetical protein FRC17_004316, partial [Serendipita sp. 399]
VLDNIAEDIKKETQNTSEVSQRLETYWSRVRVIGREAVLANVNAEKIASYQEQLRNISFDVIENTIIQQAVVVNDIKAILMEQPTRKSTTAVLKHRPRIVSDFVGRQDILASMCATHLSGEKPFRRDGPTVTVLTAMGGSGKTQIAVKFASMFEERYPGVPVFFLDASSGTSLKADLDTLVRSQTSEYDDALAWLADDLENWLLILDNADDPSLNLPHYIPRCARGHVVITTRDATRRLLAPRSTHVVDVLPIDDSVTLLLSSSGSEDNEVNRPFARNIAEELGRLPLALSHAAAYILIHDCLDIFLDVYSRNRAQFLKTRPDLPQDYPHSVERTIEMSFRSLSSRAQDMMQLFAHLDARSIPRCVIQKAAEREFVHLPNNSGYPVNPDTLFAHGYALQDIFSPSGQWDDFEFDAMVQECLKYSLLQLSSTDGERFYSMHALVQKYLQSVSTSIRDCPPGQLVVRLLASTITVGRRYEFFTFNRLLAPHIRKIRQEDVTEPGDHNGFGFVFVDTDEITGITHLEQSLAMWRSRLDEDDDIILLTMTYLADSYWSFGKPEEALPLQQELLRKRTESLGPNDPNTLVIMDNLANTYSALGQEENALPLIEEVLQKRREILGPDNLDTIGAMNNLASTYFMLGRVTDSHPLYQEVFEKRTELLGPEHRDTLVAVFNLLLLFVQLGMTTETQELATTALPRFEKIYGPDYKDT